MKRFVKVLDSIIDTEWLVASYLNKDHTKLYIKQSENSTLEFTGTVDEIERAQVKLWEQIEKINKESA